MLEHQYCGVIASLFLISASVNRNSNTSVVLYIASTFLFIVASVLKYQGN